MRLLLGGIIASAAIAMVAALLPYSWRGPTTPVSAFGRYHGYADAGYDGTNRVSAYLTLRDGTRLPHDLILPTTKGSTWRESLPVLFKYTPYLRTWTIFDEHGKNLIADFVALSWQEKAFLRLRYWLFCVGGLVVCFLW